MESDGWFWRRESIDEEKKAGDGEADNDDEWLFRSATPPRGCGPEKHPFSFESRPGSKATGFRVDLLPRSRALRSRGNATSFFPTGRIHPCLRQDTRIFFDRSRNYLDLRLNDISVAATLARCTSIYRYPVPCLFVNPRACSVDFDRNVQSDCNKTVTKFKCECCFNFCSIDIWENDFVRLILFFSVSIVFRWKTEQPVSNSRSRFVGCRIRTNCWKVFITVWFPTTK